MSAKSLFRLGSFLLLLPLWWSLQGCAGYQTATLDEISVRRDAETRQGEDLRVTVAVLSDEQAERLFGIDLGERWIQAAWIEVENRGKGLYWLLKTAIDPNVYSPDEVAYSARFFMSPGANDRMVRRFRALSFENPIPPGSVRSGFVFVSKDEGDKEIDVVLIGRHRQVEFDFFLSLPGLKARSVRDIRERSPEDQRRELDTEALRARLRALPCCTTDATSEQPGDPINLVLVGNPRDLFPAFVRRGWHPAEETYAGSVWKTIGSFLFGRQYRYSPISPMYLFGRRQDIGLQKARGTIHQRNHLRLWLSPWRWRGKDVWVGAISRDIGVRFTTRSPFYVTHKIDPDVDEARNIFIEGMLFSGRLAKAGYVTGAGRTDQDHPGFNLTGDPYFHDGMRAVLVFDKRPIPIADLEFLGWAASDAAARHLHGRSWEDEGWRGGDGVVSDDAASH